MRDFIALLLYQNRNVIGSIGKGILRVGCLMIAVPVVFVLIVSILWRWG